MTIEKEISEIKASLKETGDGLRKYAEQSEREIKAHSQMSAETKSNVDKLLVAQGALQERLAQSEQLLAKLESGQISGKGTKGKTLGQLVVAHENHASLNEKFRGSMSFEIANAVTELPESAGDTIEPTRAGMVAPVERRLYVRDLLAKGTTDSNSVEFVRETGFTNNAAPVSENPNDNKPESDLTFEKDSAPVVTIAHWIHASKQVLSDSRMLQSYIDGRLRYGLRLEEDDQLLNGSGTGLNIDGLRNQATAYSNPGVVVQNETMIDRLRIAMLQVALAEYTSTGFVLNPIDWAEIELKKDLEDRYIFTNPTLDGTPRLWGLPVVATTSMPVNNYLTGAFAQAAMIWDREGISVEVSTEDRDNFVKNMVTILAEMRLALTVFRPEAFVKGAFSSGL